MFSSNTSSADGGYQIQRSLRFNGPDSAYLSRTPSSSSNRKTWTWSAWIKRSNISVLQALFGSKQGIAGTPRAGVQIEDTDALTFIYNSTGSANSQITTTAVYRDVSAWYHIVLAVDTTQATNTNRLKLYVNGVQVTAFSTADYPTLNEDLPININTAHIIGGFDPASGLDRYFRGYMTEVNFIDGQALTPSSFGETNAQTGVWQPKAYSGSYGTNGFYLNFSDNSNTTAATLGKDYSGNGNNWTPNNFSVTAGAGNDSLVDTPTPYGVDTGAGGSVRGNYATLNPLILGAISTISNGNLDFSTTDWNSSFGTITIPTSGKWYWEIRAGLLDALFGIAVASSNLMAARSTFFTGSVLSYGYYGMTGTKNLGPSNSASAYGATFTAGDIIGVALDMDAGTLVFYKNGVSQGTAFTGLTDTYVPAVAQSNTGVTSVNFGQRPFAYTAPSGFRALCTQNLPTPAIGATTATQASQYFTPVLYTGDGTNNRFISAGMTPDWTWIKERGRAASNFVFDTLRGAGTYLSTNQTGADNFAGNLGWTNTGPTSGGFKVDAGTNDSINYNTGSYVAWNWKANGAGVTNTAGSITSTVSANTTSGFSIVTFTGTGSNATVGHGLGTAPSMIITKVRNQTGDWVVYSSAIGSDKYLLLNTTTSQITNTSTWQNTAPTSSVFYIGSGAFPNGWTQVAYCFAEVPGFSRFGSYVGNGSNDGPFVYCGFKPRFLITKASSGGTSDWAIIDTARSTFNVIDKELFANLSDAESSGFAWVDALSNGFKCRQTYSALNVSGVTYIFMAFAESPFKYALAQ